MHDLFQMIVSWNNNFSSIYQMYVSWKDFCVKAVTRTLRKAMELRLWQSFLVSHKWIIDIEKQTKLVLASNIMLQNNWSILVSCFEFTVHQSWTGIPGKGYSAESNKNKCARQMELQTGYPNLVSWKELAMQAILNRVASFKNRSTNKLLRYSRKV